MVWTETSPFAPRTKEETTLFVPLPATQFSPEKDADCATLRAAAEATGFVLDLRLVDAVFGGRDHLGLDLADDVDGVVHGGVCGIDLGTRPSASETAERAALLSGHASWSQSDDRRHCHVASATRWPRTRCLRRLEIGVDAAQCLKRGAPPDGESKCLSRKSAPCWQILKKDIPIYAGTVHQSCLLTAS